MSTFSRKLEGRVLRALSRPFNVLHRRLNAWFLKTAGGDQRPVVFDIDQTAPELRVLEKAFPDIRGEFLKAAGEAAVMPRYHEIDPNQKYISASTPHNWRMFYLYSMGEVAKENAARCPKTVAALKRIPHLFQASFSILDPGKSVPEHEGPYYGYLRYHLAIEVPTDDPPHIRVHDHVHQWRVGESVLFDDSWNHEVVNHSAQRRVVLIVDVLRPMPRMQHLGNRVFTYVGRFFYGRMVIRRIPKKKAAAASGAR